MALPSTPPTPQGLPAAHPLAVLVLARDEERRRRFADALRTAGVRVFETANPEAAAASLEAGGFDAALVSLGLPELDAGDLRQVICPSAPGSPVSLDAAARAHVAHTLAYTGGNRRKAALILGISRSTLLHKIRRYGLDEERARRRSTRHGET